MSTEAVLRVQRRGTLCSAVSTVHNHGGHTESFQSKRMGLDLKEAEGLKRTPILMGNRKQAPVLGATLVNVPTGPVWLLVLACVEVLKNPQTHRH